MQASSEHSVCFAVPESEVKAVSAALHSRFQQALDAGRLSKVCNLSLFRNLLEVICIFILFKSFLGVFGIVSSVLKSSFEKSS